MDDNFKTGLDLVRKIRPVSWVYDKNACLNRGAHTVYDFERIHFGVLAQDLAELLPIEKYAAVSVDDKDNLMVNYMQLIGPLISAVQELAARVEDLEGELNEIRSKDS